MRAALILIAALLFIAPLADAQILPSGPRSERGYWTDRRKLLDRRDQRSVRAQKIFARVLAAADKRPGPSPTLIILDEEGYPWARSLVDGAILLTRGALDICFARTDKEVGDTRLAFILGHELSHQVNGDFWHFFFYQGARPEEMADEAARQELAKVVRIAKETDSIRSKELKADQYGLLYASLAGYTVAKIFHDKPSRSFFAHWAAATNEGLLQGVSGPKHPQVIERLTAVRLAMKRVAKKIETFDKGVRAYQAQSYTIAKYYFEDFLSSYQSREAYNNLGLVYYQMAIDLLSAVGKNAPKNLSLILDTHTRARSTLRSGQTNLSRRAEVDDTEERFLRYAQTAVGYFGEATRRDPTYAVAHSNQGAALYLTHQYNAAVGALNRAIDLDPNLPEAYNNRAVAMKKLAESLGVSLDYKIRSDLQKALALRPGYEEAQRNRKSID